MPEALEVPAPEAQQAWLASLLQGEVRNLERVPGGLSRTLWFFELRRAGTFVPLVMLQETGTGPFFGTVFNMTREARLLQALRHAGVKVPECLYAAPDGSMMILERLDGRASFNFDSDAEKQTLIGRYVEQLASLHALPAATLALPFAIPGSRAEATAMDPSARKRSAMANSSLMPPRISNPRAALAAALSNARNTKGIPPSIAELGLNPQSWRLNEG